ncbi:MAG: hypothetical protein WC781_01785 [Candidatus Pacearchaeota archaeon]|jgi:hypothetical protein
MIPLILWLVAAGLIALIFIFLRAQHFKHKTVWVIIVFVALFFFLGFMLSIAGRDINYNSFDGIKTAGVLYMGWLGNTFDNVKTLTGNAIKMDWAGNENVPLAKNTTKTSKTTVTTKTKK